MNDNHRAIFQKASVFLMLVPLLTACSTVTIRPKGGAKDYSEPYYIDSKSFYFFGPLGKHTVDVNEVCEGNEVTQMQTVTTSSDWFLSLITVGIYTPRTVKIWCKADQ